MSKPLISLDFETVPDLVQVPYLLGEPLSDDLDTRHAGLKRYMIDNCGLSESALDFFPPLPLHKILTVGMLIAEIKMHPEVGLQHLEHSYSIRYLTCLYNDDEASMLGQVISYFENEPPRFVTYNGRSFELPLLRLRAMRHGLKMPWIQRMGDRWDNYDSRYSHGWHADVMDLLTRYGAAARMKLSEAAICAKLPGKIFGKGSSVFELYKAGRYDEIAAYCEMDVLTTYLLFVKYQYLSGFIGYVGYVETITDAVSFLQHSSSMYARKFLEEWAKMDPSIDAV